MSAIGAAYAAGATAWADGPTRLYGHLAQLLVEFSPEPLREQLVLDLGSGTGVGSQAALAAGAHVVAADLALDMLCVDRQHRPPAAAGDATALPFRDRAFDIVLAPFSLNHLDDPALGVREAGRVGDLVVASTYASDDDHPAKAAVELALGSMGWQKPEWYTQLKAAMAAWGSVETATNAIERGGLRPLLVERHEVPFPDLGPEAMVAWRLGLAQSASFMADLTPSDQARVVERALELLGPEPDPVIRKVIFLAAAH